MKSVENLTLTTPCTNRPIFCSNKLCNKRVVWSYNMQAHYEECHRGLEAPIVSASKKTTV